MGPSGAGKCVLLQNMILDIYRDCFERVYIFSPSINVDHTWLPAKSYSDSKIHLSEDEPSLYSDTYDELTSWEQIVDRVHHFILPLICYMIGQFTVLTVLMKNSILDVIKQDYIRTARAKGLSEQKVYLKHALRNGLLPVITVAGDQAAAIANGAVIVETIFGWPGIGKLMIDSIMQRDFAVVQASILITAIVILSINIIIDIAYAILDPRIRHK